MDGNDSPPQTNYDYDSQQGGSATDSAPEAPEPKPGAEQASPETEEAQPAQGQPAPEQPAPTYGGGFAGEEGGGHGVKEGKGVKLKLPNPKIIVAVIALIAVLGVALFFIKGLPTTITTTTTAITTALTTSVQQSRITTLSGCSVISKPGMYVIAGDFNTTITSGPCILINSSNVQLAGNQHTITGSGPYSGVPPYTYGIEIEHASNVSITSIRTSRFSYGLFMNSTEASEISNDNFTESTLSGIYVFMSGNNTIEKNQVSRALSKQGGIYMASGGNNMVRNNTIINNVYYGLVVNSTNNNFYNNIFASNPADLVCNATSAFRYTNQFGSSTCMVNDFCEFADCQSNVPFNISSIRLSPGSIGSCGSIYIPGDYYLSKNLSTSNYLNVSNPAAKNMSCLNVFAPNVRIDCRARTIGGSGYGVYLNAAFNTSVSNCAFTNDRYGVYAASALNPQLTNTTATGDGYGVYIANVTGGRITNIRISNDTYGVFLNSSFGVLVSQVSAEKNTYGVYTTEGGSNIFNGGDAFNNTRADFYCSSGEFNSSTDLMQNMRCGITDCMWATCNQKIPPMEKAYPVSGCMNITYRGSYALKQNLLVQNGGCFNIRASDVTLDCGSHLMRGSSHGDAISIANVTNVTISNCGITLFGGGVNITNSNVISLKNINITSTNLGVSLRKVALSNVAGIRVSGFSISGFSFNGLNSSIVTGNRASQGFGGASAFVFDRANNNLVFFNNATTNPGYGFLFVDSNGNNAFNNSAFDNTGSDYMCEGSSTGLYSETFGINFGLIKSNCGWMMALSPLATAPQCAAVSTSTQISFQNDMFYTAGATCFNMYGSGNSTANYSSVNCNGHIVYADHGGTFVNIVNSSGVRIENCVIINFTTGVSTTGPNTYVLNNTMLLLKQGVALLNGSRFASVMNNRIQNSTNGITLNASKSDSILFNNMYNAAIGINASRSENIDIENNTLSNGVSGLTFRSTISSILKGNSFMNMVYSGLACYGNSTAKTSANIDLGGNSCSNNMNCTWMKSPACMP